MTIRKYLILCVSVLVLFIIGMVILAYSPSCTHFEGNYSLCKQLEWGGVRYWYE